MRVLAQLDPEGCLQCRCNKLRRRKYSKKVNTLTLHVCRTPQSFVGTKLYL